MNTVMSEMRNTLDGISGILEIIFLKISENEDITTETIQNETREVTWGWVSFTSRITSSDQT